MAYFGLCDQSVIAAKLECMKAILILLLFLSSSAHATIFWKLDDNTKSYYDPRVKYDRAQIPALNAVAQIFVEGYSPVPALLCEDFKLKCNPDTATCDVKAGTCDKTKVKVDSFQAGAAANMGSGFAINECLVVTNHHVAFQKRAAEDFTHTNLEVRLGDSGNYAFPFAFISSAKVVAHGNRPAIVSTFHNTMDWAILKTDKSIYNPKKS